MALTQGSTEISEACRGKTDIMPKTQDISVLVAIIENMDYLNKIQQSKKPTQYSWQQKALDMWGKLNLGGKPTSSYFKCFKKNETKAVEAVYFASDATGDILKAFFWRFNNGGN